MAGRWPGDPQREVWVPPPGWVKPTKPVQSWYDKGQRLTPVAEKAAPAKPTNLPTTFFDQLKAFFESAGAGASSSPERPTTDWYKGKRSLGTHRMAGRWPGDPKRELWVPPPGWEPAAKPAAAAEEWPSRGGSSGYHRMAGRLS